MNLNIDEIWKDIGIYDGIDYSGVYQVSNLGNVRTVDHCITDIQGRSHLLRGHMCSTFVTCQYERVHLSLNGKSKTVSVHRLVALAFVENPNNYKEVNHIDENKLNNAASNLEWCTRSYNQRYHSLRSGVTSSNKVKRPVRMVRPQKVCANCGKVISQRAKTSLCLNCYRLLNPNRKPKSTCKQCGKELIIPSHTGYCWDCYTKNHTTFYTLFSCGDYDSDRKNLNNLLQSHSISEIARMYKVTPYTIRSWKQKLNIS